MKHERVNSLDNPLGNSDRLPPVTRNRASTEAVGRTVIATNATLSDAIALHDELASYLTVIEHDEPVARHLIGLDPLTVGRDPARDIVLLDAQVSRLHLQVLLVNAEVVVEDLGSSNGTFFEGQRLTGPVVLAPDSWVRVGSRILKHERRSKREIEREEELRRDLEKARSYVQSLLPAPIATGPIRTDWFFCPCTQLGGDALSYDFLDEEHVAFYLVDVAGHGAGAAMHSVTVLNVLRGRALPDTDFRDPSQVLRSLNALFPMETHDGLFFTIWYGVYSKATRRLSFSAAGHHPGFLFAPGEAKPLALSTRGLMIGAAPQPNYLTADTYVPAGGALYLFSDGAFEITTADGRPCGLDEFLPLLAGDDEAPGKAERIYRAVRRRAKPGPLDDDFSVLIARFD